MQPTQHGDAPPVTDAAAPRRLVPPEWPSPPPAIGPFAATRGTPPPHGFPPPPPAPVPHRSRSALGRLTLWLAVLAVGVVALIDMAGASVPASVYLAVPLAVVAGGLVIGARYGRARGLIGVGIVVGVLLVITTGVETWSRADGANGSVTWRPTSVAQLAPSYHIGAGTAVLDLSGLTFTGSTVNLDAHVSVGNLRILLPSTVDVEVHATVRVGNSTVFGQQWDGIGQGEHTITDNGADGPGGGQLTIHATVNLGDLEVRR